MTTVYDFVAIDFTIEGVNSVGYIPPTVSVSPSGTLTAVVGNSLSANIHVSDDDNENVNINAVSYPSGVIFSLSGKTLVFI